MENFIFCALDSDKTLWENSEQLKPVDYFYKMFHHGC